MDSAKHAMDAVTSYFSLNPPIWQLCALISFTICSFVTARLLSRTRKRNILYVLLPVTVFLVLCVAHALGLVTGAFLNVAVAGTISGIMMSITPAVFQSKQLILAVKREELTSEVHFENYDEVTARIVHSKIAESLSIPSDNLKIESGKGGFVEDLDSSSLEDVIHSVIETSEAHRSVCYVVVMDSNDGVIALEQHERKSSRNSIVSLLTNKLPLPPKLTMKAEVRLGTSVHMIGKMPNAADDASSFSVSCVQTYAAATTNSSAKHMPLKFWPWNSPGSGHCHDSDETGSVAGLSTSTPDTGPVRSGSSVVIECEGK